jgi:hypothetical protein
VKSRPSGDRLFHTRLGCRWIEPDQVRTGAPRKGPHFTASDDDEVFLLQMSLHAEVMAGNQELDARHSIGLHTIKPFNSASAMSSGVK